MTLDEELARWREWPGPARDLDPEPSEPWGRDVGAPDRRHAKSDRDDS